jgi:hypothetical protein
MSAYTRAFGHLSTIPKSDHWRDKLSTWRRWPRKFSYLTDSIGSRGEIINSEMRIRTLLILSAAIVALIRGYPCMCTQPKPIQTLSAPWIRMAQSNQVRSRNDLIISSRKWSDRISSRPRWISESMWGVTPKIWRQMETAGFSANEWRVCVRTKLW